MRTVDPTRMRAPAGPGLRGRGGRGALARAAAPLPLGAHAGAAGDGGLVEMAAWRPFGPVRYPTWWVSEMWVDRAAPAVHYRHVRGITTGMDVVWRFEPAGDGTDVTIVHDWTGPALAAHRRRRRDVGDRPGVHPWNRVADPGGDPAGGGGGTA